MITLEVGLGLLEDMSVVSGKPGVYMIMFETGEYYIGSSIHLNTRIRTHISAIKSNFDTGSCCRALRQMRGFDGRVSFMLLHSGVGLKNRTELLKIEKDYIKKHEGDSYMLNIVPLPVSIQIVS